MSHTPDPAIYAYIEHPGVWLEKIHFSLTALEIHLGRDWPMKVKLRVVGSGIEGYDDYIDRDFVSIPLPNGHPDYLKIVLLEKNTWLDYFIDDRRLPPSPFKLKRDNVTFADPELQEKVKELIDRGEGKTIEFKYSLKSCSSKIKWLRDIIAFANGNGGTLIIGVNDENGAVVGIKDDLAKHNGNIAKFEDEITNEISNAVYPVPEYSFIRAVVEGKNVLVISMEQNDGKCYAAYQHGDVPVFYIRRGATTRVADHNEVQELVRLKSIPQVLPEQKSSFDGYRFSQE